MNGLKIDRFVSREYELGQRTFLIDWFLEHQKHLIVRHEEILKHRHSKNKALLQLHEFSHLLHEEGPFFSSLFGLADAVEDQIFFVGSSN